MAPIGASLEDFDWRISMAKVVSDGPFSNFTAIDRTLVVINGVGLSLDFGDGTSMVLSQDSEPLSFAGDTPTSARLLSGEILDLNVMTRRTRFAHRLVKLSTATEIELDRCSQAVVIAALNGVTVQSHSGEARLSRGDSAILTLADDVRGRVSAACCLVLLSERA